MAAAMSLEALNANLGFDERFHKARGFNGAIVPA